VIWVLHRKPKKTRKTADLARWTRGRYLWDAGDRSPTRVMMMVSADRTKVLQMAILSMMRAVRTVFCDVLENAALLTDQVVGRRKVI
jgi:hypothetical protein